MEKTLRVYPLTPRQGKAGPAPPPGPGRTPCSRSQGGTGFLEIPEIRMHFVKQLPEMLQDLRVRISAGPGISGAAGAPSR